jgi:hypothetical protein
LEKTIDRDALDEVVYWDGTFDGCVASEQNPPVAVVNVLLHLGAHLAHGSGLVLLPFYRLMGDVSTFELVSNSTLCSLNDSTEPLDYPNSATAINRVARMHDSSVLIHVGMVTHSKAAG